MMKKVNKSKCKGKECKHMCVTCIDIITRDGENLCYAFCDDIMNCVTGKMETTYHKCSRHNKNGDCGRYKQDDEKMARICLLEAVRKYKGMHYSGHETSITEWLVEQLENALVPEWNVHLWLFKDNKGNICIKKGD